MLKFLGVAFHHPDRLPVTMLRDVTGAEARGGLHIVEQSLWAAVPAFMRTLSTALMKHCGRELPLGCTPITFGSWIGGDRDGNPNVTARTTHDVSLLARWMASDLFLREMEVLRFEVRIACYDALYLTKVYVAIPIYCVQNCHCNHVIMERAMLPER